MRVLIVHFIPLMVVMLHLNASYMASIDLNVAHINIDHSRDFLSYICKHRHRHKMYTSGYLKIFYFNCPFVPRISEYIGLYDVECAILPRAIRNAFLNISHSVWHMWQKRNECALCNPRNTELEKQIKTKWENWGENEQFRNDNNFIFLVFVELSHFFAIFSIIIIIVISSIVPLSLRFASLFICRISYYWIWQQR